MRSFDSKAGVRRLGPLGRGQGVQKAGEAESLFEIREFIIWDMDLTRLATNRYLGEFQGVL